MPSAAIFVWRLKGYYYDDYDILENMIYHISPNKRHSGALPIHSLAVNWQCPTVMFIRRNLSLYKWSSGDSSILATNTWPKIMEVFGLFLSHRKGKRHFNRGGGIYLKKFGNKRNNEK